MPKSTTLTAPSKVTNRLSSDTSRCTTGGNSGRPEVVHELVGGVQSFGRIRDDAGREHLPCSRLRHPVGCDGIHELRERYTHEVLHRDVIRTVDLAEVEDAAGIGMVDARGDAGLVEKHLHEVLALAEVRMDALDRDETIEAARTGRPPEVYGRHAAGSDLVAESVTSEAALRFPDDLEVLFLADEVERLGTFVNVGHDPIRKHTRIFGHCISVSRNGGVTRGGAHERGPQSALTVQTASLAPSVKGERPFHRIEPIPAPGAAENRPEPRPVRACPRRRDERINISPVASPAWPTSWCRRRPRSRARRRSASGTSSRSRDRRPTDR